MSKVVYKIVFECICAVLIPEQAWGYSPQNIADVAEVALPFAEKEIRSAVNSVLGALNKVKDYPNQAFSVIERGKMR